MKEKMKLESSLNTFSLAGSHAGKETKKQELSEINDRSAFEFRENSITVIIWGKKEGWKKSQKSKKNKSALSENAGGVFFQYGFKKL